VCTSIERCTTSTMSGVGVEILLLVNVGVQERMLRALLRLVRTTKALWECHLALGSPL